MALAGKAGVEGGASASEFHQQRPHIVTAGHVHASSSTDTFGFGYGRTMALMVRYDTRIRAHSSTGACHPHRIYDERKPPLLELAFSTEVFRRVPTVDPVHTSIQFRRTGACSARARSGWC